MPLHDCITATERLILNTLDCQTYVPESELQQIIGDDYPVAVERLIAAESVHRQTFPDSRSVLRSGPDPGFRPITQQQIETTAARHGRQAPGGYTTAERLENNLFRAIRELRQQGPIE